MKIIVMQPYTAPSYGLKPNTFITTLFWNTPNLCSSLNAKHQVSAPIMLVLYI